MYENYPIVQELTSSAVDFIIQTDRMRYIDAYYIIEDMISTYSTQANNSSILVGGPIASTILLSDDIKKNTNKDSFSYEIYIENPYPFAKEMCQKIYTELYKKKKGEKGEKSSWIDTINVETNVINKIYTLWIDLRQIVRFIAMDKYRNKVSIATIVKPLMRKSILFPNIDLPLVAPEVLLIDIYQKLYNPYPSNSRYYKTYHQLLQQEIKLFNIIEKSESAAATTGGSSNNYNKINNVIKEIIPEIIKETVDSGGAILIGDYAKTAEVKNGRLQLLSMTDPKGIEVIIGNILTAAGKTNFSLKIVNYDIHLPVDIYIKKSIIYCFIADSDDSQIPICEIFNSPQYELISTISSNRAGLAAQMRFRLIDIWVLLIIKGLNESCGKNNSFILSQIKNSFKELKLVREEFYKSLESAASIFELFPISVDKYFGTYIDENVRKKMMIMEECKGKRFPRFFPYVNDA